MNTARGGRRAHRPVQSVGRFLAAVLDARFRGAAGVEGRGAVSCGDSAMVREESSKWPKNERWLPGIFTTRLRRILRRVRLAVRTSKHRTQRHQARRMRLHARKTQALRNRRVAQYP